MSAKADRWIGSTTTGCVALLALIAATVSYLHMHTLVALHGQPGWVAALTPLSVDGMIVAASTTLLADSRLGARGGVLPWALLVVGSIASLTANVAVAEPTLIGRVIAAWPSFALTASYELLTRQVRSSAARCEVDTQPKHTSRDAQVAAAKDRRSAPSLKLVHSGPCTGHVHHSATGRGIQHQAWQWALANRADDGSLPSGKEIAHRYGRHERWGRLVKRAGLAGELSNGEDSATPQLSS